jgi:AraC-like DNA-binding protein
MMGFVVREWVRYRRAGDQPLEAMHARFERHVYHRHSHDTYSFGVTEHGAQTFTCRGERHTSAAGMVMAFNPDDPHDGWAADETGFTYRIVHIGPELLGGVLADRTGRGSGLPLFAAPVLDDPVAAAALRRLHAALMGPATPLARDERLAVAVATLHRRATTPLPGPHHAAAANRTLAAVVRDRLHARYLDDLDMDDLARSAGHSRFAVYRAFRAAYGLAPSDYQRQLRVRAARDLIVAGRSPAAAAAAAGFADQAHLTRWFVRYLGLTPGALRRAAHGTRRA